MPVPAVLLNYGTFQSLGQQAGLIQTGPRLRDGCGSPGAEPGHPGSSGHSGPHGFAGSGVLLHYTDPFLLRGQPLRELRQWKVIYY